MPCCRLRVLCCGRALRCTESKRSAWLPPGAQLVNQRSCSLLLRNGTALRRNTARVSRLRRAKTALSLPLASVLQTLANELAGDSLLATIRHRRAARQTRHKSLLLRPLDELALGALDLDDVADLDEERHLDDGAGLQGRVLGLARRGRVLQTRLGVRDLVRF